MTRSSTKYFPRGRREFYYYQAIYVNAVFSNLYEFKSNSTIQLRGYLYNDSFIPQQLSTNLLTSNNDGDGQFYISSFLEILKGYILVITTRNANTTGPFTIVVTSPITPAGVSLFFK